MIEQVPVRLRRRAASEYLASRHGITIAVATLAKFAVVGGGPTYRKAGRTVLYDRASLDRWAAERLGPERRSTSDAA